MWVDRKADAGLGSHWKALHPEQQFLSMVESQSSTGTKY